MTTTPGENPKAPKGIPWMEIARAIDHLFGTVGIPLIIVGVFMYGDKPDPEGAMIGLGAYMFGRWLLPALLTF